MVSEQVKVKKRKVAWGITGGGDKIAEFLEVMKEIKKEYESTVEIQVFLSKAAVTASIASVVIPGIVRTRAINWSRGAVISIRPSFCIAVI